MSVGSWGFKINVYSLVYYLVVVWFLSLNLEFYEENCIKILFYIFI